MQKLGFAVDEMESVVFNTITSKQEKLLRGYKSKNISRSEGFALFDPCKIFNDYEYYIKSMLRGMPNVRHGTTASISISIATISCYSKSIYPFYDIAKHNTDMFLLPVIGSVGIHYLKEKILNVAKLLMSEIERDKNIKRSFKDVLSLLGKEIIPSSYFGAVVELIELIPEVMSISKEKLKDIDKRTDVYMKMYEILYLAIIEDCFALSSMIHEDLTEFSFTGDIDNDRVSRYDYDFSLRYLYLDSKGMLN